ncbi:YecA family protein [Mesobacillus maritimus]|uniref:YecA family protein n=1 Tax=Mesobacillus maritimus TaxID=1643336 RepID=UPI00384B4D72
MTIGRNEPCPCGSGKKYKQCCLKKAKVVELGQAKRDHFFQLKHRLTERLMEDVLGSYTFSGYQSLMKEFKERTSVRDIKEEFVRYWLMFFYRHPAFGGLRGIEWYNRKKGRRDEPALQRMAHSWESLVPRLIQHVDFNEQGVLVEDLFSNERFHMPYCETLPEPQPWAGALCLLEEWNGSYYMNGVAAIVGPRKLKAAERLFKSHLEETGDSYEKAAFDVFPEMTGALLQEVEWRDKEESELAHITLVYSMTDVNEVMTAVHQTGCLEIDEWDGRSGKASLVKNRYRYDDNLASGAVFLNEIEAILEIEGNQLTYQSFDQAVTEKFKRILVDIPQAVLTQEEKDSRKVPGKVQANSFSVSLEKEVPPVFASFAQQALLTRDLHLPLPLFNGKTPAEMVALDKHAELEQWLREIEYGSYRNTKNQTKEKWTADFNSVRKALNRPPSPFTTLQERRESSLVLLENPLSHVEDWKREELELWDEMGLSVDEIKSEYARDLLEFFQEKGAGKSPNTFYKYRLGVQVISYFFEEEAIQRPTEILPEQWEKLIGYYYLHFNQDATANQAKGFMTMVKSFAAWLDKRHRTAYGSVVKQLVKELETLVLDAITILDAYTPYHERRYEFSSNVGEFRRIFENGEVPGQILEGCFLIKSVTASYVNLVKIDETAGQVYKTKVRKEPLSLMQPGMVVCGALSQKTNWTIYSVARVYLGDRSTLSRV